jgi:hypothetical protein
MDPVSKSQTENSQSRLARFGDKLAQFPKGVSPNPGGRPKKTPITKAMAKIARSKAGRELLESAIADIIAKRGMAAVLLIREMAERLEGPVTQNFHIDGHLTLSLSELMAQAKQRREQLPADANAA